MRAVALVLVVLPLLAPASHAGPADPAGPGHPLTVAIDLPPDANPGEILLLTVFLEAARPLGDVEVRAEVPLGWRVLPSWRHSGGDGGTYVWLVRNLTGHDRVFLHVVAPAGEANGTFEVTAAGHGRPVWAEHTVLARPLTDPQPSHAPRQAVVAAGYVASLTAPPGFPGEP